MPRLLKPIFRCEKYPCFIENIHLRSSLTSLWSSWPPPVEEEVLATWVGASGANSTTSALYRCSALKWNIRGCPYITWYRRGWEGSSWFIAILHCIHVFLMWCYNYKFCRKFGKVSRIRIFGGTSRLLQYYIGRVFPIALRDFHSYTW